MDDYLSFVRSERKEGRLQERKAIAKRLKQKGIFNDNFICEITKLDLETIQRMKVSKPFKQNELENDNKGAK